MHRNSSLLRLVEPENERDTFTRNVGKYLSMTRCNVPEDLHVQQSGYEYLKCHEALKLQLWYFQFET